MNRPVAPNVLRSQQKHLQPAGQRALRWRIQARRPHPRTSGLISSSLGLALLVLAGSAAIVAGALSLVSASSRGSDAEQAREAAEEGYNRVIDLLNDPGNSYLLVTKRDNWTSNTVTAQERQTCNISSSTTGAISAASIIETPTPFPSVGNGRQVRYTLESFTPPQYPGAAPSGCTKFGNLAGGTARLVIRGDVLRNGSVIASHRIDGNIHDDKLRRQRQKRPAGPCSSRTPGRPGANAPPPRIACTSPNSGPPAGATPCACAAASSTFFVLGRP